MKNGRKTMARVLSYIGRHRYPVALSLLLAAVQVAVTLIVPYLCGRAIDQILESGVRMDLIIPILSRAGLLAALGALAQWLMNALNNRVVYQVVRDLRRDAIRKIQRLPLSWIDSHAQGDLVSRVIADADAFSDGLLMGFTQVFTGLLTIFGTLAILFRFQPVIAAVVVLVTPLSLFVARFIARRTHDLFVAQSRTRGEMTAMIDEMIGNARVVQAYGHEGAALEAFDGVNARMEDCSMKATFYSSLTNPATRFVNAMVYAGVALAGGIAAVNGHMTVGLLTSFLYYANQYTRPFNEISGVVTELQNAVTCAARLLELIDAREETPDAPDAADPGIVSGEVVCRDVSFSYAPDVPLIEHMNIAAAPGSRVAIVGPTGCGKTTIINLLMRFYDVKAGAILVDGTDIRDMRRARLRSAYGMVLQDTWLKEGTIRENIAYGDPDAGEEDIIRAAKAAHAHSFIRRLPQGYDTVIGEDGGLLSQGQKQLLCIARVMLHLPPMLILDEATSSIDTRTELRIQSAFSEMMRGKTSFIVAHRLSTIRGADVILVMRDGKIVEQGKHAELLEKGGFYAELYNAAL